IEESAGDYLLLLDADDVLTPAALSTSIEALDEHPDWGAAYGNFERIDTLGRPVGTAHRFENPPDAYAGLLQNNFIAAHDTVLYRRETFGRLGRFDVSLRACEDYEIYLRLAKVYRIGGH